MCFHARCTRSAWRNSKAQKNFMQGGRVVFSRTVQWDRKPSSSQNANAEKGGCVQDTAFANNMAGHQTHQSRNQYDKRLPSRLRSSSHR